MTETTTPATQAKSPSPEEIRDAVEALNAHDAKQSEVLAQKAKDPIRTAAEGVNKTGK